jgi:hypothetical protein
MGWVSEAQPIIHARKATRSIFRLPKQDRQNGLRSADRLSVAELSASFAEDRDAPGYLILARHSFRRSSSERTCVSMASCNAVVPLLDNSAEAFRSRFCFQSRIACLVAVWASDVALRYVFMQASAIEHVLHS